MQRKETLSQGAPQQGVPPSAPTDKVLKEESTGAPLPCLSRAGTRGSPSREKEPPPAGSATKGHNHGRLIRDGAPWPGQAGAFRVRTIGPLWGAAGRGTPPIPGSLRFQD